MSKFKKAAEEPIGNFDLPTAEFIPEAGQDFVVTPYIEDLTQRAYAYLSIGYAVHLSGPAGTGKSTLAMHIAAKLGRPCTLLHGDDEFRASDLLGKDTGYQRNSIVDNYVSSIVKTEETMSVTWTSNRLTTACQQGHTLIYDEFTRSPATANNPFLSILEEGILNIPSSGKHKGYIKVHPNFRAIFTSNPEEYVAVHKTQDALLDRMITLRLGYPDKETETAIVCSKSKRTQEDATTIVNIVRAVRGVLDGINGPTVRAAIAIARILDHRNCPVDPNNPIFLATCRDVLSFNTLRQSERIINESRLTEIIQNLGIINETQAIEVAGKGEQPPTIPPAIEQPAISGKQLADEALPIDDAADVENQVLNATNKLRTLLNSQEYGESSSDSSTHSGYGLAAEAPLGLPRPPLSSDTSRPDTYGRLSASSPTYTAPSLHISHPPIPSLSDIRNSSFNETASPQQMLESAITRLMKTSNSRDEIRPASESLSKR